MYLLAMVGIGLWHGRKARSESEYVLASRSMPAWAVGLSFLATAFGALDFIGNPEFAFKQDLSFLSIIFSGWIAAFLIAWLLIPVFYRSGALTIYGYLGQRFGLPARVAGGAVFVLGKLLTTGAGMFVTAIALGALIKQGEQASLGETLLALAIVGVVGTAYTAIGGIRTVIWTDVIQMIVIFTGGIFTVISLLYVIPLDIGQIIDVLRHAPANPASADHVGQVAQTTTNKLELWRWNVDLADPYNPITAVLGIVFFFASFGTDHNYTQRLMTCRSSKKAAGAVIGGYGLGIISQVLFLTIGLLLFVYNDPSLWGGPAMGPRFADAASAYPNYLIEYLPWGVTGLLLAALFAAMMSSFDSTVAAIASSFIVDLARPIRHLRRDQPLEDAAWSDQPRSSLGTFAATIVTGTLLTLCGALAVIVFHSRDTTLIDFVLGIGSLPHGSLLGVFLTGVLTRRGNIKSVIAAMIVGLVVWVFMQPGVLGPITDYLFDTRIELAWTWWTAIATLSSFLTCLAGKAEG